MPCNRSSLHSELRHFSFFVLILLTPTLVLHAHDIPAPTQLSFGAAGGTDPVIAVDSRGGSDVAWIGSSIFFARSTDGGASFSDPKEVAPLFTSAADLQIGLDSRNNIGLSWTTPEGIFFLRSTNDGHTFSAPTNVVGNSGDSLQSLQMFIESRGDIGLAWLRVHTRPTGSSLDAFFSQSTDGGKTFSTPVDTVSISPVGPPSGNLQSLVGPKGQIYIFVTSLQEKGGGHTCTVLFSRSTNHGDNFSSPVDLSSASGPCGTSRATVDLRGNIDVALSYSTFSLLLPAPQRNVLFRRSTDDGASFSAPVNVSGSPRFFNDPDINDTPHFQIFAGCGDEIYIVWRAFDPGASTLFFARSKDNAILSPAPEY